MRKLFLLLAILCTVSAAKADEGMWLLKELNKENEARMQELGFTFPMNRLYDEQKSSLKDAVVIFGGGCSGVAVSKRGLIFTNHHCGYGAIQKLSAVEHDYLKDGFAAKNNADELHADGLTVSFLRSMVDVTDQIVPHLPLVLSEIQRELAIDSLSNELIKAYESDPFTAARVVPYYARNKYYVVLYDLFRDVRLVVAPPSSVGKFGGDTDNWMWPRHTGDFSLFRIYAGKDNQPADYSPDNIPYRPRYHLTISAKGVQPGDFTMVYGYPGRTRQYVLSPAVDYLVNRSNPHKIRMRALRLEVMNREQAKDPAVRIQYSNKNAGVSNSWKKWQGESRGILNAGTMGKKQAFEKRFQQWAEASGRQEYITLIPSMKELYRQLEPYMFASEMYSEAVMAVELLRFASTLESTLVRNGTARATETAHAFFKDYFQPIDQEIFELLFTEFHQVMDPFSHLLPSNISTGECFSAATGQALSISSSTQVPFPIANADYAELAAHLYSTSVLTDRKKTLELLAKDSAQALSLIREDPAFRLVDPFVRKNRDEIQPRITEINRDLNLLYRTWMQAIMEFDCDRVFYPDANSTLRISYGTVQGYSPADAVMYLPVSTIEGIMQKDNPQIFDYDIPQALRDIYAVRDF
ncbi:MAG TPA: peptidase S46, partial [Rikenellaceae bacterium]|nr:peptidase S46 [Rikenellaceae bacterium]